MSDLRKDALTAIRALREWVQAVPDDTPLPAMPGIDGDWLDEVEAALAEPEQSEPVVTDAMVHAALKVQSPHLYAHGLRHPANGPETQKRVEKEISTAREMLEAAFAAPPRREPEQSEPCLYLDPDTGETWTVGAIEDGCRHVEGLIALFTNSPRREPLSDEQIARAWSCGEHNASAATKRRITRAIEQAHGITGEKT
jgi:hypothetical protein